MHVELVVPALLATQGAEPFPALEMLLARGRRSAYEPLALEAWLQEMFDLQEQAIAAGALTALACGLDPATGYWMRADPVHLRADRDRLLLMPGQSFALGAAEAEQIAAALARHFSDRFSLHAVRPDVWVLQTRIETELRSGPPIELVGANVDAHLPDKRWHALLNEMQMAMYQHPVNTEREARGDPVVNSVWLWGGGRLPAGAHAPWQSVSAGDPIALGLARLAGIRERAVPERAGEWLAQSPDDGRHLVVLDELRVARALGDAEALARGLRALEERWFAPLLEALRSSRIGMVTLHAPEAGTSFEAIRGDLRRFWRRPRRVASYSR